MCKININLNEIDHYLFLFLSGYDSKQRDPSGIKRHDVHLSVTQQGIITPEGELIDAFLAAVCNEAQDFEALDQVAELEEILTLNIMSQKQGSQEVFDISALKQERNTWRLVGRLYHDELMQAQNEDIPDVIQNPLASEKEIVEHAFITDKKLRRAQVIADWLEFNARKDVEDLQMKIPAPATIGNVKFSQIVFHFVP